MIRYLLVASLALPMAARAQDVAQLVSRTALRVCADPHDLPFSNEQQQGFENKIADLVGKSMGLPVQYTWFPDSQGFLRATLMRDRCDVVVGTVVGNTDVSTTEPYYHTGYMIVTRDEDHITATNLGDPSLASKRFGLIAETPPTNLLVQHNLMDQTHIYPLVIDTRVNQPSHDMLQDLVAHKIDAALLWGPFAGYYIHHDNLKLHAAFLDAKTSGGIRLDYHIAMGVRPSDTDFRRALNRVIAKQTAGIAAILTDFGIPMLDEQGRAIAQK